MNRRDSAKAVAASLNALFDLLAAVGWIAAFGVVAGLITGAL